ncbi:MAG: hypothetical protein PHP17_07050 [Candidatus Omnitrophica bacterium]|nr:hypothetical protein [Candidatus Omnitrophota bacterium]
MTEKVFKIVCSSGEHLTAETIAMALLRQVSMGTKKTKVFFAVREVKKDNQNKKASKQVCFIE